MHCFLQFNHNDVVELIIQIQVSFLDIAGNWKSLEANVDHCL